MVSIGGMYLYDYVCEVCVHAGYVCMRLCMCGVHVCEVCLYVRMYMYVCMCGMYEHMT